MSFIKPKEITFTMNDGRYAKTTEESLRNSENLEAILKLAKEDLTDASRKRLEEYIKMLLN